MKPFQLVALALLLLAAGKRPPVKDQAVTPSSLHAISLKDINGKERSLSEFKGKVLLLVNVASECGYTYQYKGLQELYERYRGRGLEVLGFPANNFGAQEPGGEAEIKKFCELNYGVSFPLFAELEAKGPQIHPLYRYLTTQSPFPGEISWNFNKFLAGRDGTVIARFSSDDEPTGEAVTKAVEKAL